MYPRTGKEYVRSSNESSTSNLDRHIRSCNKNHPQPGEPGAQPKITDKFSKYTEGGLRQRFAEWVTARQRPDIIVEDPELQDIVAYLNPDAHAPSASTLRRDVNDTFEITEQAVKTLFTEYEGRFNLILDAWTSPNALEFLGVIVSFAHEGRIWNVVLDLIELTEAHTGEYMATEVYALLDRFGIVDRVLGIAGDNASNNDKMLVHLGTLFPFGHIAGTSTQIRCFGHIINLIYKAICSVFEKPKPKRKKKGEEEENEDELMMDEWDEWDDDEGVLEDDEDDLPDEDDLAELTEAKKLLEELDDEELKEIEATADPERVRPLPSKEKRKEGISAMSKVRRLFIFLIDGALISF